MNDDGEPGTVAPCRTEPLQNQAFCENHLEVVLNATTIKDGKIQNLLKSPMFPKDKERLAVFFRDACKSLLVICSVFFEENPKINIFFQKLEKNGISFFFITCVVKRSKFTFTYSANSRLSGCA